MAVYLGLDVGTSHLTALAVDAATGEALARRSVANSAETTAPEDARRGRSEWDARAMVRLAWEAARAAAGALRGRATVAGVGVCGQMHGMCLVQGGEPVTPFVGWQDGRGDEPLPGGAVTYAQRARELGRGEGDRLASGMMGVTLYWLREQGFRFAPGMVACLIPDLLVSWLTGEPPCADPSNADSAGLFDPVARRWRGGLAERLGLPNYLLPPLRSALALAGWLRPELAAELGAAGPVPVTVAIGDNQASYAGSVADPRRDVALTLGTGGQLSAHSPAYLADAELESRCYLDGGYLVVDAELCGGESYALLADFYRAVGRGLLGVEADIPDGELYERMNRLAAGAPPGAGGVACQPLFAGTRRDPRLRASWSGIGAETLTPAHLTRALLEGLVGRFAESYRRMRALGLGPHGRLVGAGNALRRNPLLRRIAAEAFGLPLALPVHAEEAAYGAALAAAVGAGEFPDLAAAARLIRYETDCFTS